MVSNQLDPNKTKNPFKLTKNYLNRICNTFGVRFVIYICLINLFLTGILYETIQWSIFPIFKSMGLDAGQNQIFTAIISSPYAVKPLFGLLSDLITIGGYNKKWWIALTSGIGFVFSLCLFIPHNYVLIIVCYTALTYQISIADLLSEGAYTKIMTENPKSGSDIITLATICKSVGQILAISFLGVVIDKKLYFVIFIIMSLSSVIIIVPTITNFISENKLNNKIISIDKKLFKNWKHIAIIAFCGLAALLLSILSVFVNKIIVLVLYLLCLIIIVGFSFKFFSNIMARIVLYQVLVKITKPSLGSAMKFFYTANTETCLPGGPGFDYKYYITYAGLTAAVISLFTGLMYQLFLSRLKFRPVLIITSILLSISGLSDLIIVLRWNIKIGIPDAVFYIFGESVIEKIVKIVYYIPLSIMISKVCQQKMESSTYAFLAGVNELAVMTSKLLGVVIFESAGIKSVVPCNFDNLYILIIVCHIVPPLLIGIPLSFLIPNVKQTDDFATNHDNLDLINHDNLNQTDDNLNQLLMEINDIN